jgi:S1-C subfamily serine protease
MKSARWSMLALLATAMMAVPAAAQWYPGQNRNNNTTTTNPNPNRNNPGRTTVTSGPARAPDDKSTPGGQDIPENRQTIPNPTDTKVEPPAISDGGFANAIHTALPGLVHIFLDKNRKALGFLVAAPDKTQAIVITNFLTLTGTKSIEIRNTEGSNVEVEGLLSYNEHQDLALILVKAPDSRKVKLLELADKDPKEGATVYAIGEPTSHEGLIDWSAAGKVLKLASGGDVEAISGTRWIRTEPIISDANRGGPLLNNDGKVVGLCTSPGRPGRGPHLSVPVSEISKLLSQENLGVSNLYPTTKGGFTWPESKPKKPEIFPLSIVQASASRMRKALDCDICEGHGYMIVPQWQVDANGNKVKQLADKQEICEICGGAGVLIKTGTYDLLSTMTKELLNPDPKIAEADMARIKALEQEGFDRAAVNRLILANILTPQANKTLEDPDKNRDVSVTFIAQAGPKMRCFNHDFQWVRAYESDQWVLTFGANIRAARGLPTASKTPQPVVTMAGNGRYVLVTGIVEGYGTIESNKNVYRAPLLRATDIATLREGFGSVVNPVAANPAGGNNPGRRGGRGGGGGG